MAVSNSFSNQGALPYSPLQSGASTGLYKKIGSAISSGISGLGRDISSLDSNPVQSGSTNGVPNIFNPKSTQPGFIKPTTPVKSTSVTTPDGTTVTQTHHAPQTTPTETHTPIVTETTDTSGYSTVPGPYDPVTGQLKPGQLPPNTTRNTGNQPNTFSGYLNNIGKAAQMTPDEAYYNNMAVTGKQLQNVNTLGQFAEAPFYAGQGQNGQPLTPDTAAPDLQGRAAGTSELASDLGNIYGSAAQQGYANALQQQNLGLQGAEEQASLAQPQQQYPFVFNPTTGTYTNASTGGVVNAQDAANAVLNGTMTYDQAKSALGYLGSTGEAQLQSAIQKINPNANITQLQAQGAAQQNITGTQTQQKAQYQSSLQQGQALQSQLKDLITTFGLNPSDINAVNTGLQKIAENTSSPQYKTLQNYVNDVANTYSQILTPPGGSATDTTRSIASSMLDATAQGQSLISVMQSLDQAAQAKIANVITSPQGGGSTPSSFAESWF